jgi:DNA polymerase
VIVALGSTAAQALLGNQFRVTQQRGKPVRSPLAEIVIATVHPSAVLRAPSAARERARREFFTDLEAVAAHLGNR